METSLHQILFTSPFGGEVDPPSGRVRGPSSPRFIRWAPLLPSRERCLPSGSDPKVPEGRKRGKQSSKRRFAIEEHPSPVSRDARSTLSRKGRGAEQAPFDSQSVAP